MDTPKTPLEWVRVYRRLHRRRLRTEDAFAEYARTLFKVSSYTKWTREQLDAALAEVRSEPIPEPVPVARERPPINRPRAKRGSSRSEYARAVPAVDYAQEERRRRIARALAKESQTPALVCLDCGRPLPCNRKRPGRCVLCRVNRRRTTHRLAKHRWRQKQHVALSIS